MRYRRLALGFAALAVLAAAALVPTSFAEPPAEAREHRIRVPFELSGLYSSQCVKRARIPDDVEACLARYPIEGFTPSPRFDPFHRALYYDYFAGTLVPCLRDHGLDITPPSRMTLRGIDVSAWYLLAILRQSDFDRAIGIWDECPLVPSYLKAAAYAAPVVK